MIRRSDLHDKNNMTNTDDYPMDSNPFDGIREKQHSFNWDEIPQMEDLAERSRMIAKNPVKSARMFDKMVRAFHKTILRL